MNKWMIIPAFVGTIAIGGVALANGQDAKTATSSENLLTLQQAKEIALKQYNGHVTEIELEKKKTGYVYDVEVVSNGIEYDLDIDAITGKVTVDEQSPAVVTGKLIKEEEAIRLAKKKVAGTVMKIELDDEDDRAIYEVELKDDQFEYEVKLDAVTGEVLKVEKDRHHKSESNGVKNKSAEHSLTVGESKTSDKQSATKAEKKPSKITMDQAIAIAKQKANEKVTDSELDDGIYEIEIKDGDIEYEFEIDAFTGTIISFEQD